VPSQIGSQSNLHGFPSIRVVVVVGGVVVAVVAVAAAAAVVVVVGSRHREKTIGFIELWLQVRPAGSTGLAHSS
jgi:hypothetical protein